MAATPREHGAGVPAPRLAGLEVMRKSEAVEIVIYALQKKNTLQTPESLETP